jgi:hypothetical protein
MNKKTLKKLYNILLVIGVACVGVMNCLFLWAWYEDRERVGSIVFVGVVLPIFLSILILFRWLRKEKVKMMQTITNFIILSTIMLCVMACGSKDNSDLQMVAKEAVRIYLAFQYPLDFAKCNNREDSVNYFIIHEELFPSFIKKEKTNRPISNYEPEMMGGKSTLAMDIFIGIYAREKSFKLESHLLSEQFSLRYNTIRIADPIIVKSGTSNYNETVYIAYFGDEFLKCTLYINEAEREICDYSIENYHPDAIKRKIDNIENNK